MGLEVLRGDMLNEMLIADLKRIAGTVDSVTILHHSGERFNGKLLVVSEKIVKVTNGTETMVFDPYMIDGFFYE
jgi:hypothetical protein